jgi:hypothetical protein
MLPRLAYCPTIVERPLELIGPLAQSPHLQMKQAVKAPLSGRVRAPTDFFIYRFH